VRVSIVSKGRERQFDSAEGTYYKGQGDLQVIILKIVMSATYTDLYT